LEGFPEVFAPFIIPARGAASILFANQQWTSSRGCKITAVCLFGGKVEKGVVTSLEIQKRDKERVNVYLDGKFAFSLNLMEAAQLRKGQVLTEAEIEALQGDDTIIRAVNQAARFLSYRPRSVQEIRQNLAEKNIDETVIDTAIERLTEMGYVDDLAFARFWVENRSAFKPLSPQALRYELRQKGIADSTIREVLAEVDAEETAYRAALGRAQRLRGTTHRDFREKIAAFLQRRGFSYDDIHDTTQRLLNELDAQDPDYFQPDDET
jgi:regulatory protein